MIFCFPCVVDGVLHGELMIINNVSAGILPYLSKAVSVISVRTVGNVCNVGANFHTFDPLYAPSATNDDCSHIFVP